MNFRPRRRGFALDPSVKLWLPLDKYGAEQAKAWDQSGNNNHGTITGAVPWAGGFKVAQSSMKISNVSGAYFLDWGWNTNCYPGQKVQVFDSVGKQLVATIASLGTGETYGDELVTNGNMETGDPPSSWEIGSGASASAVADERTGGAGSKSINGVRPASLTGILFQSINFTAGKLYYISAWRKNVDATSGVGFGMSMTNFALSTSTSWNEFTKHYTAVNEDIKFYLRVSGTNGQQGRFDDISIKQILTPSATGLVITAPTVDSGFNYTDSSGYTVYPEGQTLIGWQFDGVDDVITITDFLETGNSAKELTVLCWQRYLGTAAKYFFAHWDSNAKRAWRMTYQPSNLFEVTISDDGSTDAGHFKDYVSSINGWSNGQFMLAGFTFNNGTLTLYANGVADTNPTKTTDGAITTIHNSTANLTIGCALATGAWSTGAQCVISEVAIFNRALTEVEIRNYYEMTRGRYGV